MTFYSQYSVLPALRKLQGSIFCVDDQRPFYLSEKQKVADRQPVFFEYEITPEIYHVVTEFIRQRYLQEHGVLLDGDFSQLAMQLQEDITIHRRDWLAAAHVCFPSGWSPAEKIGMTFRQIHEPIPDMNLDISDKLVNTMICHGPFERIVWGVTQSKALVRPQTEEFDPSKPVYVKYERQITYGFPEIDAALFVIRQHLLEDVDLVVLKGAVAAMTEKQKAYKGISVGLQEFLAGV